ncbi:MAG TPA: ATP-binding protein [Phycisphaerales bacterium]|nr:ATP-binding protein [Phycisphaerales bacterium]
MVSSTQEFGESFMKFMKNMNAAAPVAKAYFPERLAEHFKASAESLPIVAHKFPLFERPNVQRALDEVATTEKSRAGSFEVIGITSEHKRFQPVDLPALVAGTADGYRAIKPGPVEYQSFDLADGHSISCISSGLILLQTERTPLAILVSGPSQFGIDASVTLDVMGPTREIAESFLARLRSRVHALSVYKGHALSVEFDARHNMQLRFHRLPAISREDIILPEDVLARIERRTIDFSLHAAELAKAGRHLKRGILLHGPPGTGKTLTAMHLAARMVGRTVVLATGRGHGALEYTCTLARTLQPSTVILEDVDLFAQDRETNDRCTGPLLFELLNQMDGLAEDADILFVLTTNRPESLEPALAARPGRIDQAIEVPLPDEQCRRRLITLYAKGVTLNVGDLDQIVSRTAGASAAFIREMLRRAALLACLDGKGAVIENKHLDEALREIVITGGLLTRKLLGFESAPGVAESRASAGA